MVARTRRGPALCLIARAPLEPKHYAGSPLGEWSENEITFAFEAVDPESLLELRFAWEEDEAQSPTGPPVGRGWRLIRHEYRPDFRLYRYEGSRASVEGRTESGFVPPAGVWCRARVSLVDDGATCRVRARFAGHEGAAGGDWSIDAHGASRGGPRRKMSPLKGHRAHLAVCGPDRPRASGPRPSQRAVRGSVAHAPRPGITDRPWRTGSPAAGDGRFRRARPPGTSDPAARIVLVHDPDLVQDIADIADIAYRAPDLVMAGHTHGGQVRLPFFGAFTTSTRLGRRYDRGLFRFEGVPLYITAGTGTSILPIRFFDPPEVTLVTLVPAGGR
jgi:hypothetical protein